jgi:hypothetical protein
MTLGSQLELQGNNLPQEHQDDVPTLQASLTDSGGQKPAECEVDVGRLFLYVTFRVA